MQRIQLQTHHPSYILLWSNLQDGKRKGKWQNPSLKLVENQQNLRLPLQQNSGFKRYSECLVWANIYIFLIGVSLQCTALQWKCLFLCDFFWISGGNLWIPRNVQFESLGVRCRSVLSPLFIVWIFPPLYLNCLSASENLYNRAAGVSAFLCTCVFQK